VKTALLHVHVTCKAPRRLLVVLVKDWVTCQGAVTVVAWQAYPTTGSGSGVRCDEEVRYYMPLVHISFR
jgi:hypothetical protein